MGPPSPYRQIFAKIMTIAVTVALVPLFTLGGAIYYYFYTLNEKRAQDEIRNLAESRANALQLFLTERTTQLELLASTAPRSELASSAKIREILTVLNHGTRSFVDLGVIDHKGDHIAYHGPFALTGRNYRDAYWFQETMVRGVFISDVFLGYRGVPHFVIAVKVDSENDPLIIRATIDSEVFVRLVRYAQLGASGDAYIVNNSGILQTPSRFGRSVLEPSDINPQSAPAGISVTSRVNGKGQGRLTAYAWLPKEGWLLVVDQDPREGLALLIGARNIELAILAGGSILIVLTIFFLVRLVMKQVEASEREKAALDGQLVHSSRLAALGRMAAGVAHEINNPLAAIGEISGLMDDLMDEEFIEKAPGGAKFKEYVNKIGQLVDRAGEVTRRMLGFARRMEPKLDQVDINEAIRETFSFFEKEAMYRRIELVLDLAADMPKIMCDRSQLQQVFLNLLNNAIDAVKDNGHVWVETQVAKDMVIVIVRDDGPGMDKETLGRIFDPFFTTKAPGEGTGLGLSISHSIMTKLGGSLMATSSPGQGATFAVRIPKVLT